MNDWLVLGGCVFALVLASVLALILTIVFRKRLNDETTYIFLGLIPLEFSIVFFGWPIAVAFAVYLVEIF